VSVVLLLTVILASYICVRVGAVAFELTGIPWDQAKFQALSAFSNCGFTTRETEDIVGHPLRRRIASSLIILGNAGVVTTIATFAGALVGADVKRAALNLLVISLCLGVIAWVAKRPILARRVRLVVQRWLSQRVAFQPSTEALLRVDQGYGVTRLFLPNSSPALGRTLSALEPWEHRLQILALERDGQFVPIPDDQEVLRAGDAIVVYGTDAAIQAVFGATVQRHLGSVTRLEGGTSNSAQDLSNPRAPRPS
jgi:TrkA-C domain